MADTKISQLPAATTPLSGAEVVPLVQSGATVQTPANEIRKLVTQTANTFTANQGIGVAPTVPLDMVGEFLMRGAAAAGSVLRITPDAATGANGVIVDTSWQTGGGGPLIFKMSSTERMRIDSSGNVGIGTSTSLGTYGKLRVGGTGYQALNVGSDDGSGVNMIVAANAATEGRVGTVTNHPVDFYTNGAAKARLDTSGNLLITSTGGLGYGTGSGGTVTQLTNKSTGVTINKTNGQIVTAAGSISAGSATVFTVTNSTVAATDTIIVHRSSGGTSGAYTVGCEAVSAGSFRVCIDNITAAGLNEILTLNFAVIKAVTS